MYENYSLCYNNLLEKLNFPSLQVRRMRTMAVETFKIVNDLSPPVLSNLVVKRNSNINFRYTNILQIPQVRTTTYGKNSFRYAAPSLWNSLPDHFRQCSSFSQFKNLMLSWNGKICKCRSCNTVGVP